MSLEPCNDNDVFFNPPSVPEWKRELVNRVRLAKTGRAGIYNAVNVSSSPSPPLPVEAYDDEQRNPLAATNERRSLDRSRLKPDFHLQQRASTTTFASSLSLFRQRRHRDTLLFQRRCRRRCRSRETQEEALALSSSSPSTLVDNMKLLNEVGCRDSAAVVKHCARVTTSLSPSSNLSSGVRENYVKHVIEMNEEKCYDKSPSSVRYSTTNNKYSTCSSPRVYAAKIIRSLSPPTTLIRSAAAAATSNQQQRKQRNCDSVGSGGGVDEDGTSDSSEELQYGPGIVNRLRTKYMSMTLRDNQKKFNRPSLSNMRKANSLDNLVDGDLLESRVSGNGGGGDGGNDKAAYQISSVISCVNKLEYSSRESNVAGRVTVNFCADLKRARSMETLQEENDSNGGGGGSGGNTVPSIKSVVVSQTKGSSVGTTTTTTTMTTIYDNCLNMIPLDSIVNEDIIIVENSVSTPHNGLKSEICGNRAHCTSRSLSEEKRTRIYSPFGGNKELPPPDVVKETLKIFENCQSTKKSSSPTKSWKSSKEKAAPKPTLYPKPSITSAEPKKYAKKSAPSTPPTTAVSVCNVVSASSEIVENGIGSPLKNGILNGDFSNISPVASSINSAGDLPNHSPVSSSSSSSSSIKVNFETKQRSPVLSLTKNSAAATATGAINVNVVKNTSQIVSTVKKSSPLKENGIDQTPSPPPRSNVVVTAVENGDCKYRHDILKPSETLPVRQVGVIRPLLSCKTTVANANTALTAQEIEQNYINAQKNFDYEKLNGDETETEMKKELRETSPAASPQQSPSSNSKENGVSGANNTNKPSALWVNKPWNQQQNTMVFNFKDRKEVPDYIENDGLLLTSNRERAKKILQEGGGTGYIILGVENGISDGANESSTDSPNISCKEEWQLISGPPSPCNVHFEGDNIVINGKSNLRKHPKDKKLRIQFNDASTTTFEYPSEASLLEEDFQNVSTNGESDDSTTNFDSSDMVIVPCSTPKMTSPLSGSSLASYVPSKLSMGESFELGVTKSSNGCVTNGVTNNTNSTSKMTTTTTSNCTPYEQRQEQVKDEVDGGGDGENCDYLKPASENENVAWSEESIPDLLF